MSDISSTAKVSHMKYAPIEDVEPFERYVAGGYCPVQIGDTFCSSRYRIVHKLGHGASSTIWLARDEHLARYVAIKILIADLDRPLESAILKALRRSEGEKGTTEGGVAIIPEVLDEFEAEGPEIEGKRAKHHCLVTAPARMNLSEAREASNSRLYHPSVAHAIAAQLVRAIAFLHSRGVVHADLHDANVLLRLPASIDNMTTAELYKQYGSPEFEAVKRLDGLPLDQWVPTHGVVPIWFGGASDTISLAESRVLLNDFSESLQPAVDARHCSRTPLILRSPDLLVDSTTPITFSTEIWSLACAIFSVMGQRPLFESWFPSVDSVLDEHVDTLGRLPEEQWAAWLNRSQYFDEELQRVDGATHRLLQERLEYSIQEPRREFGMAEMDKEEMQAFLSLLRSMLAFKPEDRLSAQQVLESTWMQKWAEPALSSFEHESYTERS